MSPGLAPQVSRLNIQKRRSPEDKPGRQKEVDLAGKRRKGRNLWCLSSVGVSAPRNGLGLGQGAKKYLTLFNMKHIHAMWTVHTQMSSPPWGW